MNKKQSYYMQTDLIFLFTLFVCVSLLSIYNAQQLEQYEGENFVLKQIVWFTIGACIVAAIQFLDLEQLQKASIYIYGISIFVLIVLLISPDSIARTINGAKSWFTLPGLSLQPAEFTKVTTILFLSAVISKHKTKYEVSSIKSDTFLLAKILLFTGIPVGLIMLQPDFGTAMVYLFISGMLIILSGINWRIILSLIVIISSAGAAIIGFIIKFPVLAQELIGIKQYQVNRILTWFDPTQQSSDATFHFDRAYMALGSGQLFGKGMGSLEVNYPEAHTDFIFSVIGESFGFIGSAIVIFLYFMLLYKLVTLGLSIYKHSPFGTFFCYGFLSLLLVHVFQNIGMTLGIMPITGIPLLLVSYGGSSVMSTMLGLGVIYRVAVEYSIQNDYLFK
ncbi:FtsW/RodA/SpoVE family cell cycle protein [Oceanobacillus profundus]|uniref:Rod shape-determining protein RodA n=1 Tax=Oceanobacillus profundus TaxID=372463 RepID=A0A417Y921_9BACI|nr:FtsW/RodA/SpoVE family cell cycle protein [Oceanobacillus profundus]MCM3397683.1 rod shape-determining protein RodA [Oceanobacillus profundus]MDO6451472.1 FtsW/RodA/SpoVE family cell cycle protein [Oceanobacillus profundus]PAE26978.1 cell division protein [Paenibacillus sp. 7884-2]RHW29219.1 rod shape-determining protein RodA [Oceanobacillus profundus]